MTNLRNLLLTIAALAILPGAAARADSLSVTFDPSILSARPGQTITFSGTITNPERGHGLPERLRCEHTGTIYERLLALPPQRAVLPGSARDQRLVRHVYGHRRSAIHSLVGLQSGAFTVFGGSDGDAQENLVQAQFSVDVVPEPGTAVLLGLALTLTFAVGRRRKRAI